MKILVFFLLITNSIFSQNYFPERFISKNKRNILSFETDSVFSMLSGSAIRTGFYKVKDDSLILIYHKLPDKLEINYINILSKKKNKREYDSIFIKLYGKDYKDFELRSFYEADFIMNGITKKKSNIEEEIVLITNNETNSLTHELKVLIKDNDSLSCQLEKGFDYNIEITNDLTKIEYETEEIISYLIKKWTLKKLILQYKSIDGEKVIIKIRKIN